MNRLITSYLASWKTKPRRKPLLIRGARQVGKSWVVEQFGKNSFSGFLKIDLEKQPRLHTIFAEDLDPRRILKELELVSSIKIIPGQTLLFIDEIQAYPRAIMALRYFYEDLPDLHLIAAGSLLEFATAQISFPVGRIDLIEMHPMNFLEFLMARGSDQSVRLLLDEPHRVSEAVHQSLLKHVEDYLMTGGMPEAVAAFCSTGSYLDAAEVTNAIVAAYRLDFGKYAGRADRTCLEETWCSAARNVGSQLRYSGLSPHHSFNTIKKAYHLLETAKVIRTISANSIPVVPLAASATTKSFKSIVVDLGLMHQLCGFSSTAGLHRNSLLDSYRGALAEQYIGQELHAAQSSEIYFWKRDAHGSNAEVDYLIARNAEVIPVEVKSGGVQHLKSLQLFLSMYPQCPHGIVFSPRPFEEDRTRRIRYIPLYFAYSAGGGNAEPGTVLKK